MRREERGRQKRGLGDLEGALVIFSLVVKEALRRVGGCRTQSQSWDPIGLTLWGAL